MSAIERASEDLERGDYGMARVRLASYLNTKGYDPDLLNRLGEISWEMRDLAQAGRYWIASGAAGKQVDQAIAAFLGQAGRHPRSTVSRLPRAVREAPTAHLPFPVKERLHDLGLYATLNHGKRTEPSLPSSRRSALTAVVVCVLVLGMLLILSAGLWTIGRWIFG